VVDIEHQQDEHQRPEVGAKMTRYQKDINALISFAEREAIAKVKRLGKKNELRPGKDGNDFRWDFQSEYFHDAINRMAREQGLR
jgi:hypothetical protein